MRGGAGNPPLPAGRVPRGAGRPSLELTYNNQLRESDGANQMSRTMTEDMPKFSDDDKVIANCKIQPHFNLDCRSYFASVRIV